MFSYFQDGWTFSKKFWYIQGGPRQNVFELQCFFQSIVLIRVNYLLGRHFSMRSTLWLFLQNKDLINLINSEVRINE